MHFLIFFNSCAFIIYLFLGFYVLKLDFKSRIHQLFFLMCMSLSLGVFSVIPALQTATENSISWWVKIGWIGFISLMPFFNHFYILFTTEKKINKYVLGIIYIPALFLIYKNFTTTGVLFKDFYRINNKWYYNYNNEITGIYFLFLYAFITILFFIVFIVYWRKKNKSLKTKRQSLILLISAILTFLLLILIVIGRFLYNYSFFGFHSLVFLIWIIGIYIAIVKYRFMIFTPSVVSEEIISNIDESIILLDNSLRIIIMNRKSESIFNNTQEKVKGKYFSKIFLEDRNILIGIDKLLSRNLESISYWITIVNNDDSNKLIDMKISIIKDKFGDKIGYLLIGREIRGIKQLKKMYKVTDREVEIIQYIINGCTNKEIGKSIGITLRTVKAHITNIYNKLCVNNKTELLALLSEFNLAY